MKRVTIYDVAKEAQVSLATVSRVINGSNVVKEPTRQRVEAAIEKLGYKPNAIAQGLALQKTTTIGLVVPEASFTYTGQIINGLLDVAKIYNYSIPIVLIGNKVKMENVCCVFVDIEKAIFELTMKYLEEDKKSIAIVEDRKNISATNQMIAGAEAAFAKKGLKFDGFLRIPPETRTSYAYLSTLFKDHKFDLVIGNRDSQAMAIVNAAHENGISIPDEMEVVCVIDTKYNSMFRPTISSFSIPSYDLGAVSMRMMTKMLQNQEDVERNIELSYLFTPRQTTRD